MSADGKGPGPTAGHELVDHTSEVTLRFRASSYAGLVAEATRAFASLVPAGVQQAVGGEWREFRVRARDRAALIVEWLNELVYLCEVDLWLPIELDVSPSDDELVINAKGVTLSEPFVLVKAATLHNAVVREGRNGLEGEVTLDI